MVRMKNSRSSSGHWEHARYSKEDIESIFREAMQDDNQESWSYDELMELADRLNIPKDSIDRVLKARESTSRTRESKADRRRKFNQFLVHHGGRSLIICLFLFGLNLFTSRYMWCIFPILGLMMGFGFKALKEYENKYQ